MMGAPDGPGRQRTPANRSGPFDDSARHTSSCSAPRTLMQNRPAAATLGQVVELLAGRNATRGGLSDTDVNEPTTIPTGSPASPIAVTAQTPVGYCPRTRR